jgi:hypothetical protein
VIRLLILALLATIGLGLLASACGDDDGGGGEATPTEQQQTPGSTKETPNSGTPTEPLGVELPRSVIDAVEDYVVEGNIPAFPAVDSIAIAENCTTAGEVCYDPAASSFDETTASVRVYPYASDEIQVITLEQVDGEWTVTGAGSATE